MVEGDARAVRTVARADRLEWRIEPGRRAIERADILALVPEPTDGKREVALRKRSGRAPRAAVVDNGNHRTAIFALRRIGEASARCDDRVCSREPSRNEVAPPLEVLGQRRSFDRRPPGCHAAVLDRDAGPVERSACEQRRAAGLHDIDILPRSNARKLLTGALHLAGVGLDPFERKARVDEPDLSGRFALRRARRRSSY